MSTCLMTTWNPRQRAGNTCGLGAVPMNRAQEDPLWSCCSGQASRMFSLVQIIDNNAVTYTDYFTLTAVYNVFCTVL